MSEAEQDAATVVGNRRAPRSKRRADGEPNPELERTKLSKDKRLVFLNHLAATCNVRLAAAAAGPGASYFYGLRRTDPAFAAGWAAAVQAGYDRLEEALLARALRDAEEQFDPGAVTLELVDTDADADPVPPGEAAAPTDAPQAPDRSGRGRVGPADIAGKVARVDVQFALAMLNRRAAIERNGRERHKRRRPTAAEVETALNAKLDALARRVTPLGGDAG